MPADNTNLFRNSVGIETRCIEDFPRFRLLETQFCLLIEMQCDKKVRSAPMDGRITLLESSYSCGCDTRPSLANIPILSFRYTLPVSGTFLQIDFQIDKKEGEQVLKN